MRQAEKKTNHICWGDNVFENPYLIVHLCLLYEFFFCMSARGVNALQSLFFSVIKNVKKMRKRRNIFVQLLTYDKPAGCHIFCFEPLTKCFLQYIFRVDFERNFCISVSTAQKGQLRITKKCIEGDGEVNLHIIQIK